MPQGTSVANSLFTKVSLRWRLEVWVCCACSEVATDFSLVKAPGCQAQLPFTQDAPISPG